MPSPKAGRGARTPPVRRERGELANEVVAAVTGADRPLTPAEVQAELGDDLAYTTVMTTLSRLHDKGPVPNGIKPVLTSSGRTS